MVLDIAARVAAGVRDNARSSYGPAAQGGGVPEAFRSSFDGASRRAVEGYRRSRPQIFNNAILALLGLLRYRRQCSSFLLGQRDDPIPAEHARAIREHLAELAERLQPRDPARAEKIREVMRFLEGKGTDQLIAAAFDE